MVNQVEVILSLLQIIYCCISFTLDGMEDFVVVGGDYLGEWMETPNYWIRCSKVMVPIALSRQATYEGLVERVIESCHLKCSPSDVSISYTICSAPIRGK